MAARKRSGTADSPWSTQTRERIKTSMLINLLQANAEGKQELDPIRQRSIEILLRKSLPDLSAQEIKGEVANYVARLPAPAVSADAWSQQLTKSTDAGQIVGRAKTGLN